MSLSSGPDTKDLEKNKDVPGLLTALVYQEDPIVRQDAASALGRIADARAVEPLIDTLKDSHDRVRQNAAVALGTIADPRAVEPLSTLSRIASAPYATSPRSHLAQ